MNKEAMLRVADAIELHAFQKEDIGFNMYRYIGHYERNMTTGHVCETTACVAGFTVLVFNEPAFNSKGLNFDDIARDILELTDDEAHDLFHTYSIVKNHVNLVPAALRIMAREGRVDWAGALLAAKLEEKNYACDPERS